jgi:hypothetical protein
VGLAVPLLLAPAISAAEGRDATAAEVSFPPESASRDARKAAAWVISTGDHQGMPFLIVDKIAARVLAFDRGGLLLDATPALLGMARRDDSPPGIGNRKLSSITPADRVTPSGRFVARSARTSAARTSCGSTMTPRSRSTALTRRRRASAGFSGWRRRP